MKNIDVSIIIVHYKVKRELFNCIDSIYLLKPKASFEIIVVDNDEKETIEKDLTKQFSKVKYIKTKHNMGFGSANNIGARLAHGKFLFFLNPDTLLQKGAIDELVSFLNRHKQAGSVAPLLLDSFQNPYPLQGSMDLTPMRAIICLSFINKLFPNNYIAKEYWQLEWDKKIVKEMDVVPGTAFMIRKSVFEKVGGFDEQFFLFFEENDLCKRVQKLGYRMYINPKAKAVHFWGRSTEKGKNITMSFRHSRFLYFQKYYGWGWALLVALLV